MDNFKPKQTSLKLSSKHIALALSNAETREDVIDALMKLYANNDVSVRTLLALAMDWERNRICEWLKNHSETDYYELIPNANYCGAVKLNKNKMIEDLCKAMEE